MLIVTANWYVLTGGPSSGKTTTVNLLASRGYKTTIEHARHYLDTTAINGRTVEEVRSNQKEFQHGIARMQIDQERALDPRDTVFLNRALPDSIAYCRFLGIDPDSELLDAVKKATYKKVFLLDLLPLHADYARIEDSAAQLKIHSLLANAYEELNFQIVRVPVLPPEQRVDYILRNL